MERTNTKEQILSAALELFSVRGFESTSTAMIAEAVGIRKASLYNHFGSKQEILDVLIERINASYNHRSVFDRAKWDDPAFTADKGSMTPEDAAEMVRGQLRYILHDPGLSKARKMLVIEQFRNPELSALYTERNYDCIMEYFTGMMRFLMSRSILRKGDAELMAAEFALPVSVWLNLCDREPEREPEVMELIGRYVKSFFELHGV